MRIIKENNKFELISEEEIEELRESLLGTLGAVVAVLGARGLMNKKDEIFTQSGLRRGAKVKKMVIDAFRNKKNFEGVITFKGSVPYVLIKKGEGSVGQIERWTPNWVGN